MTYQPQPTTSLPPSYTPPSAPNSTMAIVSLVAGVAGFFTCGIGSIVAIICGHMARAEFKRKPELQGAGMALAGLIMGYIVLALVILYILFWIIFVGFLMAAGAANS